MRRVTPKWRPRLAAVVAIILLVVAALPLVGLFFFRLYENQLIRQTEAELIAQGAVLAAAHAQAIAEAGIPTDRLGPPVKRHPRFDADSPYRPIEANLDLTSDSVLPRRPDGVPGSADPAFAALGPRLSALLAATQVTTLAGFRVTDPKGVVIAGKEEVGLSLAGIEEVSAALGGGYGSVLRLRVSDQPAPPLYSISRGTGVRVFVALPVDVNGRVGGVVYLSRTPNNIMKHLYEERGKVALAAGTILLGTLLIGFLFVRTVSRPVYELIARTRRIGAGDRTAIQPLAHHGTREMAELAEAFLQMAQALQDRSDAIQTFATHVSHELKSPLAAIQGAAELLRDSGSEMDEAERRRFSGNIVTDAERLTRLVRRLLELARAQNLGASGETATLAGAARSLPRPDGLRLVIETDLDPAMKISAEALAIVLANLADNSLRHGATSLTVRARLEGDTVTITATDDGEGVSANNRERIFEPFFTTRRDTGGTGLGLGIVVALLKAHDGQISLVDSGSGARFEITLPAA